MLPRPVPQGKVPQKHGDALSIEKRHVDFVSRNRQYQRLGYPACHRHSPPVPTGPSGTTRVSHPGIKLPRTAPSAKDHAKATKTL